MSTGVGPDPGPSGSGSCSKAKPDPDPDSNTDAEPQLPPLTPKEFEAYNRLAVTMDYFVSCVRLFNLTSRVS